MSFFLHLFNTLSFPLYTLSFYNISLFIPYPYFFELSFLLEAFSFFLHALFYFYFFTVSFLFTLHHFFLYSFFPFFLYHVLSIYFYLRYFSLNNLFFYFCILNFHHFFLFLFTQLLFFSLFTLSFTSYIMSLFHILLFFSIPQCIFLYCLLASNRSAPIHTERAIVFYKQTLNLHSYFKTSFFFSFCKDQFFDFVSSDIMFRKFYSRLLCSDLHLNIKTD